MTGVGCAPAAIDALAARPRAPPVGEAQATWWTVPAPGSPGSPGGIVVGVPGAALLAARPPRRSSPFGSKASVSSSRRRLGSGSRVGAHAVEALQRELARDLRVVGDQRLVVGLRRRRSRGRGPRDPRSAGRCRRAASATSSAAEPLVPEVERLVGGRRGRRSGAPCRRRRGPRRACGYSKKVRSLPARPSRPRRRGGRRSGRPGSRTS